MCEESYERRSRTRDDDRFKRHKSRYGDNSQYQKEYESKNFSNQYDHVAYKGNPNTYPERYGLHKAQNVNPRPRPAFATPEKMNEIRQQLHQRQEHDQSFINHSTSKANH